MFYVVGKIVFMCG